MKNFFKNKPLIVMFAAVLLLLILIFATSGDRTVTWVESAVGTVTQPVQTFASDVSNGIIGFFERIFKTTDSDRENEQLKLRLAQLEQAEYELEQLKLENERLKALLNYSGTNESYKYVTAKVIAKNQSAWFDIFTINAGRKHGIEKNMPVVNASGLVGRVTDVGATWAKVTSIIDSRSTVSVMVERTRDGAMIQGLLENGNENVLELYYLPSGSDLVPGDVIVTNGLGGVFPKGITVGTVTEVMRTTDNNADDERNALIKPTVDFNHIEEIMVIIATEEQAE